VIKVSFSTRIEKDETGVSKDEIIFFPYIRQFFLFFICIFKFILYLCRDNRNVVPNLYIISGCNGAGKTTASYTILPELLGCKEFVNSDEIAKGISPFNSDSIAIAIEASRIMYKRIRELISSQKTFALETTLASRSIAKLLIGAQEKGYYVTLLYFWLNTPDLAVERVKNRVITGGHNVTETTVRRRYDAGIYNLFHLYMPICDYWMITDNSLSPLEIIAKGFKDGKKEIFNTLIYNKLESHE
jgi:predicted ABC-type ATPase